MSVSHEIKSQLAKLLATEDLMVEHKKVQTACFNVHTRVLTLPLWEKASNTVYDLLVGHEVGHALFTPDEDWTNVTAVPKQFVNVVEDARVEKLMKRKYMGLAKTFFNGYKELNEDDFFCLADEDISSLNLADRANLYFKVGNFVTLNFTSEEKEIIDLIAASETFADVLIASEELYKYCKDEQKKEEHEEKVPISVNQSCPENGSPEEGESIEDSGEESNQELKGESQSSQQNDPNQPKNAKGDQVTQSPSNKNEDPEIRTMESLEDKLRELINDFGSENVYVEIPQVDLDTIIAKNSDVHKEISDSFIHQQKQYEQSGMSQRNLYNYPDTEFRKFKSSAQKEVNYLVKEFECRKSADAYARATTARTGILDTARLHSYKYTEDIFKKVTVIPDGKNHGLVFILDWSGSMQNVLLDTCKQLFNLVWFCKKVSIPFEVYAFTNEWRKCEYNYETGQYTAVDRKSHYEVQENLIHVFEGFSLLNLLTSKVSGNELEKQMINIWRIAISQTNRYMCSYYTPNRLSLSGTPLNESLIALHQILPKFQKENKLQKVQCIVLTDGEANPLPHHVEITRMNKTETYFGVRGIVAEKTLLRDRKLGTTYKIGRQYHEFTDVLLKNLKDKFPSVNFIGIRVLSSKDASRFIQLHHRSYDKTYEKIQNDWKKLRSFTITDSGYDAYFGLSSSILSQEAEFDVKEDATKAQIKSAFAKSLKTKKLNKKVLSEFIALVA